MRNNPYQLQVSVSTRVVRMKRLRPIGNSGSAQVGAKKHGCVAMCLQENIEGGLIGGGKSAEDNHRVIVSMRVDSAAMDFTH